MFSCYSLQILMHHFIEHLEFKIIADLSIGKDLVLYRNARDKQLLQLLRRRDELFNGKQIFGLSVNF